jgi:hypothetical protein
MKPLCHRFRFVVGSLFALFFAAGLDLRPAGTAESMQYVILTAGTSCSIKVGNIDIKSFRILTPIQQLGAMADSNAIFSVHVCECLLLGGDKQKCAKSAMLKAARSLPLKQREKVRLGGRIFILIEKPSEFIGLYSALSASYPRPASNLAWQILHNVRDQPTTAPHGSQPPPDGLEPTTPPILSDGGPNNDKKNHCEVESNVCINPATRNPSMEFEFKCEGLPTMVFSSDGKAGIKIGAVEVSFSASDEKPH